MLLHAAALRSVDHETSQYIRNITSFPSPYILEFYFAKMCLVIIIIELCLNEPMSDGYTIKQVVSCCIKQMPFFAFQVR